MINHNIKTAEISKKAKTKIRVAFIFNHSFFLGGGEISLFELIKNLDKTRFYPIAIVPKQGQIRNKLRANHVEVYICKFPSIEYFLNGSSLISLVKFIRVLKLKKVEVLHANGSRVALYAGIAGKILRIPIIWHVRETVKDIFCYDGLLGCLASKIICVSKSVQKKRFARFGSCINKKILVIYNGVDTKIFKNDVHIRNKIRKKLNLDGQVVFGVIGNFVPLKGQDFFLKGFALANKKAKNLKAKALLVGRIIDKEYYHSIKKLSKPIGYKRKNNL